MAVWSSMTPGLNTGRRSSTVRRTCESRGFRLPQMELVAPAVAVRPGSRGHKGACLLGQGRDVGQLQYTARIADVGVLMMSTARRSSTSLNSVRV